MHTQRRQPAYRPTRVFDGPIDSGRFRRGNGQGPTAGAEQTAGARRKASGGCFRPDSGFDSGDGRRERKRQRGRGRGKLILVAALALAALFVAQSLIRGRIETLTSPVAGKGEPASSTPVGGMAAGRSSIPVPNRSSMVRGALRRWKHARKWLRAHVPVHGIRRANGKHESRSHRDGSPQ